MTGIRKSVKLHLLKQKLDVVNHIAGQRMDSSIQDSSFCCILFNRFFKITKCLLGCLGKSFCQTQGRFSDFITGFTFENRLNLAKEIAQELQNSSTIWDYLPQNLDKI